jgi:hypothetical protein
VFLDVIRRRGRIDPSELLLRIQGRRALARVGRVAALLIRGKVNPWATLFGKPIPGIEHVRRLFQKTS